MGGSGSSEFCEDVKNNLERDIVSGYENTRRDFNSWSMDIERENKELLMREFGASEAAADSISQQWRPHYGL